MPHQLKDRRELNASTFVLRFERLDLDFLPGQYLNVGIQGERAMREYSIYSPTTDEDLEILVKEVPEGTVSPRFHRLEPGAQLRIQGPFGFFVMTDEIQAGQRPVVLIATGTGLSPMRSFVQSYPDLDYRLLHGIRTLAEQGEYQHFSPERIQCCVSREAVGSDPRHFAGRVTEALRSQTIDHDALYYLCGNCDMIYEVYDILKERGVPTVSIKTEVYF